MTRKNTFQFSKLILSQLSRPELSNRTFMMTSSIMTLIIIIINMLLNNN